MFPTPVLARFSARWQVWALAVELLWALVQAAVRPLEQASTPWALEQRQARVQAQAQAQVCGTAQQQASAAVRVLARVLPGSPRHCLRCIWWRPKSGVALVEVAEDVEAQGVEGALLLASGPALTLAPARVLDLDLVPGRLLILVCVRARGQAEPCPLAQGPMRVSHWKRW